MSVDIKGKIKALNKATESFRATKKKTISKICAPAKKHKWLMYPLLIVVFFYILFVNIAFFSTLWVILNKKKAIALGIVIVLAIVLPSVWGENARTNRLYTRAREEFTVVNTVEEADEDSNGGEIANPDGLYAQKDSAISWFDEIDVDFEGLKAINEDVVGWIYFENEDINYPILKGRNNDDYLKTTYEGKSSRSGSIFLESDNSSDFNDCYTLIYGRSIGKKSMFGKLRYYVSKKDYYSGHEFFQIITPEKKYRYQIVECRKVSSDDEIFDVNSISDSDYFVTLSTVSPGKTRYTVSAIRIAEKTR